MKTFDDIGVGIPEIQLPRAGIQLERWAVIACDQFTSEPDYWRQVRALVGEAPSALHLVLPEIELEEPGKVQRIAAIQGAMYAYLEQGLLKPHNGMLYVERRVGAQLRKGLLLCLDLERYDYSTSSSSLIRATEGTIVERLPPRMEIREGAPLELPHILVLIDDPERTVIEPVSAVSRSRKPLYDFELMLGSGHLTGFSLDAAVEDGAIAGLRELARPEAFRTRYGLGGNESVLLFAMGDGNHSLATAKAVWETMKARVGMNHPSRYALVEIENVHDQGLHFEPIHRILFELRADLLAALRSHFGEKLVWSKAESFQALAEAVDSAGGRAHVFGLVHGQAQSNFELIKIHEPSSHLAVGTLQRFLDGFVQQGGALKMDYVHGNEVVQRLGAQPGNAAFYLPRMAKSSLFKTVILDGALPRKTFSMGEARGKRFYMEARKII